MKTLLFLLFAFSCNAQEGMTGSEIYLITNDDKCDHAWITINTNPPFDECMKCGKSAIAVAEKVFYDPCINISDLIEYERKCFNDSTLVEAYIPYDCGQPFCLVAHPESKYVEYWIHREPTFTGFITWLKNRMK